MVRPPFFAFDAFQFCLQEIAEGSESVLCRREIAVSRIFGNVRYQRLLEISDGVSSEDDHSKDSEHTTKSHVVVGESG